MATTKKNANKSTTKRGQSKAGAKAEKINIESGADVAEAQVSGAEVSSAEVSGAWTVVEETVVNNEGTDNELIKENTVVHIENVDMDDEGSVETSMLYRSDSDKIAGGVCAGLAKSLGWDPNIVRILWVGATLATFGGGVAAYLAFWLLLPAGTPEDGVVTPAVISINRRNSNVLSYALIGIGALILLSNIGLLGGLFNGLWAVMGIAFWPAVMIGIGYMLLERSGDTDWRKSVREARSSMNTRFQSKMDGQSVRSSLGKARSSFPLRRSTSERMLAGVCSGIGQKVGVDANLIRFGWVVLTLFSGLFPGVVAYAVLGVLLPQDGVINTSSPRQNRQPRQEVQDVQIL